MTYKDLAKTMDINEKVKLLTAMYQSIYDGWYYNQDKMTLDYIKPALDFIRGRIKDVIIKSKKDNSITEKIEYRKLEVIGNIYENPELSKGGD